MWDIERISDDTHRAAWGALWCAYKAEEVLSARQDELWSRLKDPVKPVYGVFILSKGAPVGFAHYVVMETTSSPKPECYIQDLYVDACIRRQGGGTCALNWFKDQAKMMEWSKVTLKTRVNNSDAQALYNRECEELNSYVNYTVMKLG